MSLRPMLQRACGAWLYFPPQKSPWHFLFITQLLEAILPCDANLSISSPNQRSLKYKQCCCHMLPLMNERQFCHDRLVESLFVALLKSAYTPEHRHGNDCCATKCCANTRVTSWCVCSTGRWAETEGCLMLSLEVRCMLNVLWPRTSSFLVFKGGQAPVWRCIFRSSAVWRAVF